MASSSIIALHNLSCLYLKPNYHSSSKALYRNPISKLVISKCKKEVRLWSSKSRLNCDNTKRKSFVIYANILPEVPLPSEPPSNSGYMNWIIGMVVSIIVPFFSHKWRPLTVLKTRIDNAMQMVENVAEATEKVAEEVNKVTEHIADDLPEGQLKNIMRMVEHTAEQTAKTADSLDHIIDTVQEAEDQVECLVESIAKDIKKSHNYEAKDDQ